MKIKISKKTLTILTKEDKELNLDYSLFEVKSKQSVFSHWKNFPTTYNHFDEALFFVENLELFGDQIGQGNYPFSLKQISFWKGRTWNKITKKTINYKTESATYWF